METSRTIPPPRADPSGAETRFHPSWGTGTLEGKRPKRPAAIPSPAAPGDSSLDSKKTCMPAQMPMVGARRLTRSLIASSMPEERRVSIALPKEPTPGTRA